MDHCFSAFCDWVNINILRLVIHRLHFKFYVTRYISAQYLSNLRKHVIFFYYMLKDTDEVDKYPNNI